MGTRTMACLSYGFSAPLDLLEKLRRDGAKLRPTPDADDVFNFLVTSAALYEWAGKFYANDELVREIRIAVGRHGGWEKLPTETISWIRDARCLPNRHCDVRRHIFNALRICGHTASASKHFQWEGDVRSIQQEPIVENWYDYYHTSLRQDLYVKYRDEVYGLSQIRDILLQFYDGLLAYGQTVLLAAGNVHAVR